MGATGYTMAVFPQPSGILIVRGIPGLLFDETYLRALNDSDPVAENFLVSYFSRRIQLKLQSRLRSPELVKDACQETFLRVFTYFRSGRTLDNPAGLPKFILTVSNNVGLELLRAHTRHDQLAENSPEPADSAADPEVQVVTGEQKQIVARVLNELPEKDRALLRRVLLEEGDKDAICRDFGVDRGYLRVLLHRARQRFKAVLLQSKPSKSR
jgi:RNA polymerase sigma-70 factor (ECF subfamily)